MTPRAPGRSVDRGLAGLAGVVVGNMQVRDIGIVGYGGVFPVVALLVAFAFTRTPDASEHGLPQMPRHLAGRL
jgi:hypothetical protein